MSIVEVVGAGPVHLIGIGGAGMSALARLLLARGIVVTGSDIKDGPAPAALRALGAHVAIGHDAGNIGGARAVVVSSAIREANPEVRAARTSGVPLLHRAQLLALLMHGRRGIAITGTHGKTTTSSMIAFVLQRSGMDPSFVIGGDLNERGTNAGEGGGDWFVAEADESDGSFLWLSPEIAVVTNIEVEHLDHYGDEESLRGAFLAFIQNVPDDIGVVITSGEDAGVGAIRDRIERRVVTVGLERGDWTASRDVAPGGVQRLDIRRGDAMAGEVRLAVPGAHNARNALVALAVAVEVGVGFGAAAAALASYEGVLRRFQVKGTAGGVTVVDDYAHHPTEIEALLGAARERSASSRVLAVFQPHLYSRTRLFAERFGVALAAADVVVVTDVYGAREDPEPGVSGKLVVDALLRASPRARVAYLPRRSEVPAYVAQRARPGDLVLTIGAGDVTMLGDEIIAALGGEHA